MSARPVSHKNPKHWRTPAPHGHALVRTRGAVRATPPMRVTIVATPEGCRSATSLFGWPSWGCEASALTPPARTKSASPDLLSLRSLQTGRSPLPIFFLLPSPGLGDGQGSCAHSAQNPVTKGENHE